MILLPYKGSAGKEIFPALYRFLRYRMPLTYLDDLKVWDTFVRHSTLSKKAARDVIKWGTAPYVEVAELPENVFGKFEPKRPEKIVLALKIAKKFEEDFKALSKRTLAIYYTRVILLHELVHWGDWNVDHIQKDKGKAHKDDAGKQFEMDAYGDRVSPLKWLRGF